MRKTLFISILLLPTILFGQHDLYTGIHTDFGIINSPDFKNNSLKRKAISPHFGGSLFGAIRLFDLISLEGGIGQHWNNTRLRDPEFERENDGFSIEFNNKNYYWNYYLAASLSMRMGSGRNYIYGKLTYSYNQYSNKSVSNEQSFAISRLSIDQTISSTSNYVNSNQSFIPEIGIQHKTSDRNLLTAGIKFNIGNSEAVNGSYTIRDNVTNSSTTDLFSSNGNFASLTFSYHLFLHHIPKKEKEKKVRRIKEIAVKKPRKKPTDTTNTNSDSSSTASSNNRPSTVGNRTLNVSQKMKVHSNRVKVFIWDHQTVDGDRISLNLNGNWVLENFTLEKKKYEFEIELTEGDNIFVLHALNLGKYEPNTAALIVKDNEKSHQIILESDLNESGTLIINYKKKE